jgi:hypothetical protein
MRYLAVVCDQTHRWPDVQKHFFNPNLSTSKKCYTFRPLNKAIITHKNETVLTSNIYIFVSDHGFIKKVETYGTFWTIKDIVWNYRGCFFSCLTDKWRPDTLVSFLLGFLNVFSLRRLSTCRHRLLNLSGTRRMTRRWQNVWVIDQTEKNLYLWLTVHLFV